MSILQRISVSQIAVFAGVILFLQALGSAQAATPNLWWDRVGPLNLTQTECVSKGKHVLTQADAGKIKSDEDSLHAINDTSISVIECLPFEKTVTVMVIVSSSNVAKGDSLFNQLKDGMAK